MLLTFRLCIEIKFIKHRTLQKLFDKSSFCKNNDNKEKLSKKLKFASSDQLVIQKNKLNFFGERFSTY